MDILGLLKENGLQAASNIDTDSLLNDIDSLLDTVSIDLSRIAYVFCEKQSFRTDSLYMSLQKEYKTKLVCMTKDKMPLFDKPLLFVIDINNFASEKLLQKSLDTIQNVALQNKVPIFIMGEESDIETIKPYLKKDINITFFKRPIIMGECMNEIENVLLQAPLREQKKHIVVVDDSVTFLKLVQKTLEDKYRLTLVTSALDCIKMIAHLTEPPDIIVIDYIMPTCNGLTLCKMLREDPFLNDVPIIFLSGNDDVNEIIQLMPMIDGYMLKSQPITSLDSYLKQVFAKKEREREYRESKNSKTNKKRR